MNPKFIFITGGVVSSIGKGLAAASLGALLQARGCKVRLRKLDPYLNVDPGTLNPYQHGEVFVTDDGMEADLDLGHYERFTGIPCRASDSTTTGKIYSSVLSKERRGDYLGATVQIVPHIIDEIKNFITNEVDDVDFVLCEIGGTVGDIEGLPFLEAIRQLRNELGMERTLFIHLTLVPYISTASELKTKPTQHSVKELLRVGIQPDILLCRCDREIPAESKRKLALFCNVMPQRVIEARDVPVIYQVPLDYYEQGLDRQVTQFFNMNLEEPDLRSWQHIVDVMLNARAHMRIGIVGKYVQLPDAYKSLIEALNHAAVALNRRVEIDWIDSDEVENLSHHLSLVDGILVPGGFGERGVIGKIEAIRIAREQKIPFLGICFGMQMAVVEACRNLLKLPYASSTEFGPTPEPVIAMMTEWMDGESLQKRKTDGDMGGTMRLGSYNAVLAPGSRAQEVYQASEVQERHRHRYEVNTHYREALEKIGLRFSGLSPDGDLPEIVEYVNHPWFIGVQFHPELKSLPFKPHPLFVGFLKAAVQYRDHQNENDYQLKVSHEA